MALEGENMISEALTIHFVSGTLGFKIPRFDNDSDYIHMLTLKPDAF